MIPRGASREKLSNNGKIPFFRYMNIKETKGRQLSGGKRGIAS